MSETETNDESKPQSWFQPDPRAIAGVKALIILNAIILLIIHVTTQSEYVIIHLWTYYNILAVVISFPLADLILKLENR